MENTLIQKLQASLNVNNNLLHTRSNPQKTYNITNAQNNHIQGNNNKNSNSNKNKNSNSSSNNNSINHGNHPSPRKVRSTASRSERSERSLRSNDRLLLQTTGNPLDIWVRSAPLFQPLPSEEEINEICKEIVVDYSSKHVINHHWSEQLKQAVSTVKFEHRKSGRQPLPPLGPPPAPNDVSDYWKGDTPVYPITDAQRHNSDIVHSLLSAFVKTEPVPKKEKDTGDRLEYIPTHIPPPQIEFDDYLCYSFEERLEIELMAAGIKRPVIKMGQSNNTFSMEIEQFKEELARLQPHIDKAKDEVLKHLPEYKRDEERRLSEQRVYLDLMREFKKRSHKK